MGLLRLIYSLYKGTRVNFRCVLLIFVCFIARSEICNADNAKMNRTVLIISGHVQEPASKIDQKGAQSYTGIFEYEFNDAIVRYFDDKSYQVSGIRYDVITASRNLGLRERVEYANSVNPDLYLEIHHDAAQTEDIERARRGGDNSPLWKDRSGFSVHYSENNPFQFKSKVFAEYFADEVLNDGFNPNLYHADVEKMMCIDRSRGMYNRITPWGLYVLSNIKCPAVIIECGTIVNPHEEKLLSQENNRLKIVKAINRALVKFFEK